MTKNQIQVVRIIKKEKHPQAHKLSLCTLESVLEDKTAEPRQVVCGAQNLEVEMLTLYAPPGAMLQDKKVAVATIRGISSPGLLCSPMDLGISTENGVVHLPSHYAIGTPQHEIKKSDLTATPWFRYQKVDTLYYCPKKKIFTREETDTLISETYYCEGKYLYRYHQAPPA